MVVEVADREKTEERGDVCEYILRPASGVRVLLS